MKNLLICMAAVFLMGCITTGQYITPNQCVGLDPSDSMIMKWTSDNPSTLGKLIKTGFWSGLIAKPQHISAAKIILAEAQAQLKTGITYQLFFKLLSTELNVLDTKYMAPLVIWIPGFDPTQQLPIPISEYDKCLIEKKLV